MISTTKNSPKKGLRFVPKELILRQSNSGYKPILIYPHLKSSPSGALYKAWRVNQNLPKLKEQNSTLETGVKTSVNVMVAKGLADFGGLYRESLTQKLVEDNR